MINEWELDDFESKAKWSSWDRENAKNVVLYLISEIKRLKASAGTAADKYNKADYPLTSPTPKERL